jgi:membrane fusion protein (multidrug efflux system)
VAKSAVSRELLENSEIAVRRAAATHDDALSGLALAQREVDDSRVLSPVTGVVEQRQVEPGETVLPGQALATIQSVDSLRIVSFVSERDVNFLRLGAAATVRSPGARGRVFDANIVSIGVKADPRTGNFPVKLGLGNDEGLLRPGMTARVELDGLLERERLLIPDSAVVDRDRRKVVYVLEPGDGGPVARERRPLLRATAGEQLPVIDGLVAGERLIVTGLEWLVDGSPVRLAAAPAAADADTSEPASQQRSAPTAGQ